MRSRDIRRLLFIMLVIAAAATYLLPVRDTAAPGQNDASAEGAAGDDESLSRLLGSKRPEGFAIAREPRAFRFPEDHGPHPEFRNEWWYLTGNLDDTQGNRYGYEFTVFRFSLTPPDAGNEGFENTSSWRTNQVYIAHFAITDAGGQAFEMDQRYSRGALGLAGAQSSPFRVWLEDWSISEADSMAVSNGELPVWNLEVGNDTIGLRLKLEARKPVVLNGDRGLSRKSDEIGNASYYYSITRLASSGEIRLGNRAFAVSGTSWLDREWSSSALADDQEGWDWFALQLSDGSDLMFYNLRKVDGSQDSHSAGTWVDREGNATHLVREDVSIGETGRWESPRGGSYPARWEIELPSRGLVATVIPVMADQEMVTNVRYWEGAVDVRGTRDGRPITGRGYVELTGYAR